MSKNPQISKPKRCLICHNHLLKDVSIVSLIKSDPICVPCYKKLETLNEVVDFYSYPLTILYKYNDFFKSLLYRYKGTYDYPLSTIFLHYHEDMFINLQDFIIVSAPSSYQDNQKRGFAPVKEIALTTGLEVFDGIYKLESYKQSDLAYSKRKEVYKKLAIRNREVLTGRNVLILDDVMTSGSTLKACLDLVLSAYPKQVKLLVLSKVIHDDAPI